MKMIRDTEDKPVTTWWLIEDESYHGNEPPTGEGYFNPHMVDQYEYVEEKHRLFEPEYDKNNGKLCAFWLQLEMPRYLWHLYKAGYVMPNNELENKVYEFSYDTINEWLEEQRVKHYNENKSFYIKQK
jgi:hypothetical protein